LRRSVTLGHLVGLLPNRLATAHAASSFCIQATQGHHASEHQGYEFVVHGVSNSDHSVLGVNI
jgi:hypothetical protein